MTKICYWCNGSGITGWDMTGTDVKCHVCDGSGIENEEK